MKTTEEKLHFNCNTGKWTVLSHKDGSVLKHGTHREVEDYLDFQENIARQKEQQRRTRIRMARIRRRMKQLIDWLYNNKKYGRIDILIMFIETEMLRV